ncbi:Amino acid regulated cytosolic protein [hydrothermal vent metagenome]|uniref:Amino acid regulated cytosolic protein n=1 Tax=hydrothermal vent metagenome TaxID=652676 RepID=A0A3B0TH37_9ZZZZ
MAQTSSTKQTRAAPVPVENVSSLCIIAGCALHQTGMAVTNIKSLVEEARIVAASAADYAGSLTHPTLRLGVTGLSRSGKTVFITALVHNLLHGGRLPMFRPLAQGRIARAYLAPQPDDAVPRFDYEAHIAALTGDRVWPQSTRSISQLRLTVEYEPVGVLSRLTGAGRLSIDIVDYPGEWLLDLPLLGLNYADWSAKTLGLSRGRPRAPLAGKWHEALARLDPAAEAAEADAIASARAFTEYLRACRQTQVSLSTLPPGRFLMPGDMEGSPALTFSPLEKPESGPPGQTSLWAMMERRYEAYKTHVVRPFFRDHFARLDRQIVLVDTLAAMNAGAGAVADLELALGDILTAFRPGRRSRLARIFRPRIDRILFAATKADHLHQSSHDRLEAVLRLLTETAATRAEFAGADIASLALASVRATREAKVSRGREMLPAIVGTPVKGETIAGEIFDGRTEAAIFPGDLPADPKALISENLPQGEVTRFVRFRPPALETGPAGTPVLPHIRLDRALDFLIGDRLA